MDEREPTTEELRAVQAHRADEETELAEESPLAEEEHTHERRADKAAYLRDRLDEQTVADRRTDR